jgi:hypothetical protein
VFLLGSVGAGYWKYTYPYGWSHCCAKGVGFALREYATDHDGFFPVGGETPEASLSLLYSNYLDAYTLRGKTVSLEVVQQALAKDGKLGPQSCGWHYVEGLTEADNPEIAIVWDKLGLGHNGQRLRGGGHEVVLLDGSTSGISAKRWPEFLERQKQLLAQRSERERKGKPALTARIRFPDGNLVDKYDGAFRLDKVTKSPDGEGSGSQSGTSVPLRFFRLYEEGSITYQLTLPDARLKSKLVTITVSNSVASPDSIIFELESF